MTITAQIQVGTMLDKAAEFWNQAYAIWLSGGWCMPAIAATALVMFALGVHLHIKLRSKGLLAVPERVWRQWVADPSQGRGAIGELIRQALASRSLEDAAAMFQRIEKTEMRPFVRDLRLMRICFSAAPLLGLLGTVIGMLTTFGGLSSGSGGDEAMGVIASGISEALITTETGLIVALPGLFFQYHLTRRHERQKAFLAHLETVCAQELYRRGKSKAA